MKSNENKPFFTICTEVSNREKTIEKTLYSISKQNFIDYEYVIVDNCSIDKSHEVISNYLKNDNELNKKTTYIRLDNKLDAISSWNKPLEFANGKYIVVCEGDDWFEYNHLTLAYEILNVNNQIGMYISLRADLENFQGMNVVSSDLHGYIASIEMFEQLISFDCVPPPSNVIFRRELDGATFNYDSVNYVYAGEMSLYYDLLIQKLDAYVNAEALTVNRGLSAYHKEFFHIKDKYFSFGKWIQNGHYQGNEKPIRVKLFKESLKGIFFPQLTRVIFEKDMFMFLLTEARKIGSVHSIIIFTSSAIVFVIMNLKIFSNKIFNYLFRKKVSK